MLILIRFILLLPLAYSAYAYIDLALLWINTGYGLNPYVAFPIALSALFLIALLVYITYRELKYGY